MRAKTRPVVNFFIHLRQINYMMDAGIVSASITEQRIEMCAKSFCKMQSTLEAPVNSYYKDGWLYFYAPVLKNKDI